MKIVNGDLHDPLMATFQTVEVARLNQIMKDCGIGDRDLRRQICEQYFFDAGYFIDECWLSEQGRKFRPGIYFTELADDSAETTVVLFPDSAIGTMLHEYAHGAAAWLFDDHDEDASEIPTGTVDEA
jgi:hypothetical protein